MKGLGMLIDSGGDLSVRPQKEKDGLKGIQIGNTAWQNQYILLRAHKGELKEYPVLGVGISDITNDNDAAEWNRTIREQLEKDGFSVKKVSFEKDTMNLKIEAEYETPMSKGHQSK